MSVLIISQLNILSQNEELCACKKKKVRFQKKKMFQKNLILKKEEKKIYFNLSVSKSIRNVYVKKGEEPMKNIRA